MTQSPFAAARVETGDEHVLPASSVIKYAGVGGATLAIFGASKYTHAQLAETDICMAGMLRHSIREHREHYPRTEAVRSDVWVTLHSAAGAGFPGAIDGVAKGFHGEGASATARAWVVVDEDGLVVKIPIAGGELSSEFLYWGDLDVALDVDGVEAEEER